MNYKREKLQKEITTLIGESIKNVFYYDEFEGYETFKQLSEEVIEVPLLGILLETSLGEFYNIISYDYSPYYELGGIRIFRDKDFVTPQGRPNKINDVFWRNFREKTITEIDILESYYSKNEKKWAIPFGIKFSFNQGTECYITNMGIEGFSEEKNIYDLCRGGELVMFAGKNVFDKYSIMKENHFEI